MTPKELAAKLNGRQYCEKITKVEAEEVRAANLVVMFGASDDLVELRGAINDEVGAYGRATIMLDAKGLRPNFEDLLGKHPDDAMTKLRDYFQREAGFKPIEAVWDQEGYSWSFKTDIPHEVFDILEDDDKYCRGIVFSLKDIA